MYIHSGNVTCECIVGSGVVQVGHSGHGTGGCIVGHVGGSGFVQLGHSKTGGVGQGSSISV